MATLLSASGSSFETLYNFMTEAELKQRPPFVPNKKELELIRRIFLDFSEMRKVRERRYRLLGDRTPQSYWTEQEKRFVSYAPPKDITEDDWQSNIVMGITRNAVLSQVSKTGMKVPEARVQTYHIDGFIDDERSRIFQNAYKWSLRRESADKLQQYISLGSYVRGNACIYEGFEDKEIEVEVIVDTKDDGTVETETKTERKWGPKRQIVPLHEVFFPVMFANDIQDQPQVIWKQTLNYDQAEAELGHYKNWKYVVPGNYTIGEQNDPFFYSRSQMGYNQVEVLRSFGNPWKGGKDQYICTANGVPLCDQPLPLNHKKIPFAWCRNNPFGDKFMLGMGVPFMVMDSQDTADAIWNMALDKNLLSMQRPIMTDDPDPNIRTYLSPGSLMQFRQGSNYMLAPMEGVTSGEFSMLQESMRQAKEFTGAYGGGNAQSAKGGAVTARQAVMAEEESKRLLGISMTNLEFLEKDICTQRLCNILQFIPGSGQQIDIGEAELRDGRKGRFIAYFAKNLKEAQKMEFEDGQLSEMEVAGEKAGQPTEAVAIAPDWLELTDRMEADVVPESSYVSSKTLEQAIASEDYALLQPNPLINQEELLRDLLKAKSKNPDKLIKKEQPVPVQPGMEGQAPPQAEAPGAGVSPGQATAQLSGKGAIGQMTGAL